MKKSVRAMLVALPLVLPAVVTAQPVTRATYITREQIQHVNRLPGTDRQIVSQNIGELNLAVGIIHRGCTPTGTPTCPAPAGRGGGGGQAAGGRAGGGGGGGQAAGGGRAGAGGAAVTGPCGVTTGTSSGANGIAHDGQTETYIITSGSGTLVTGGQILNGNRSNPGGGILNGPSCSGEITGDVVSRVVYEGDVIIIPAGVPHGWSVIPDHVDYLSVRPDPQRLIPDYTNPAVVIN